MTCEHLIEGRQMARLWSMDYARHPIDGLLREGIKKMQINLNDHRASCVATATAASASSRPTLRSLVLSSPRSRGIPLGPSIVSTPELQ